MLSSSVARALRARARCVTQRSGVAAAPLFSTTASTGGHVSSTQVWKTHQHQRHHSGAHVAATAATIAVAAATAAAVHSDGSDGHVKRKAPQIPESVGTVKKANWMEVLDMMKANMRGAAQSDPDEADVNDEAVDSMDEDEEDDGAVSTETENPAVDTIEADTRQEKENRDEDATRLVGIPLKIIAGNANPDLAEAVAFELYEKLVDATVGSFVDGEVNVRINESVRGADTFIIQPTCPPNVNDNLMELLLLVSTLRRASAKRITAVVPYYGYKRDVGRPGTTGPMDSSDHQRRDTNTSAIPVSAADVARMLQEMGVDRVLCIDLQPPGYGQIEGFFGTSVPVNSLRSTGLAVSYFARLGLNKVVVVSPNEACVELAQDFRTGLEHKADKGRATRGLRQVGLAVILEGGGSRGMDRYMHTKAKARPMMLVGDVKDADVVIVDDLIDSGNSLAARVELLKEQGAKRVFCFAAHGLFTGNCVRHIANSEIERFVVTDTIPLNKTARECSKIKQISVAKLLATAIRRMHVGRSLQDLRVYSKGNVRPRYAGQDESS